MFRNDAKSAVQFVFEQRKTWGKTNIHLRLIRKTLIKKYRWYFCSAFGPPGIRIRQPFRLFCVHPKLNRTPLTLCGRMGFGGIVPWLFSFLVLYNRPGHNVSLQKIVPGHSAARLCQAIGVFLWFFLTRCKQPLSCPVLADPALIKSRSFFFR